MYKLEHNKFKTHDHEKFKLVNIKISSADQNHVMKLYHKQKWYQIMGGINTGIRK